MIFVLWLASAGMNGYADEQPNLKFDYASSFQDNVAVVQVNGKCGLIDVDGHFVVPAIYDDIDKMSFYQGTMIVKMADKYGLISVAGQEIIPIKYEAIGTWPFKGFIVVQQGGKWGVYDRTGRALAPIGYDETLNVRPSKAIDLQYGVNTNWFSEGLALVAEQNGKCGYIDETNRRVIPFVYDGGTPFQDGLAIVERNHKTGVINKDNTVIIPFQYDGIWYIGDGLFSVCIGNGTNNKYGVLDKTNKVVIPISKDVAALETNEFTPDPDRHKIFYDRNLKVYLKSGDKLIPTKYHYGAIESFVNGLAPVEVNHKWGYIDEEGKLIIPATYDKAGLFDNGRALVEVNNKCGYIDTKGKLIIPATYDKAEPFHNGLAQVEVDNKWGYIDKEGKLAIPAVYDDAEPFDNGLAPVKVNDKWGYIDRKGQFTAWSYQ